MSKTRRLFKSIASMTVIALVVSSCATGPDNNQNSLRPKGDSAEKIMNLFSPIFWIAAVVGIAIIIATIYVSFRFKATEKNQSPKQIHGNSVLEIGWTILPLIILIGVAIPTVNTIFELDKKAKPDAVKVEVVGKQWWWQFAVETEPYQLYNADGTEKVDADGKPEMADRVVTANELVVPLGREFELDIRACDGDTPNVEQTTDELKAANPCNVIHSFWLPSLGGKVDAVPGRKNRLVLKPQQEGIFTGQCAEYCGLSHSVMRMQVRVVSEAEFAKWIENLQKPPVAPSVAVAGNSQTPAQIAIEKFGCANCHAMDDPSQVSYGPNLTHFGADYENEVLGGGSIPKTNEHIWRWVYDATDWKNGWGIPMQAGDCRLGVSPGSGKRCVGMPNFSVPYSYEGPDGKTVKLPAMTKNEAKAIGEYLAKNK